MVMRQPEVKVGSQSTGWDSNQWSPWTGTGLAVTQLETAILIVARAGTKGPGLHLNEATGPMDKVGLVRAIKAY